jgi:DNA-binding NarL/FixJ family response regulator
MIHHLTWRSAPNKRFAQRLYVSARVVTRIRRVARAPVLVLSGLDSTEVREQMLQAGATDFILLDAVGGSVGNQSLRLQLDWDEPTYNAVKRNLIATGIVIPGRGRGGSVARA